MQLKQRRSCLVCDTWKRQKMSFPLKNEVLSNYQLKMKTCLTASGKSAMWEALLATP